MTDIYPVEIDCRECGEKFDAYQLASWSSLVPRRYHEARGHGPRKHERPAFAGLS
jgi:hypothetical protein